MIRGGTWEEPYARHEAARVHHAHRLRGDRVAAREDQMKTLPRSIALAAATASLVVADAAHSGANTGARFAE